MPSGKKYRRLSEKGVCGGGSVTSYHLENAGTRQRKKVKPKAELVDVQRILPENADYTKAKIVTFSLQTGSYAVRFLPNALQVTLRPKIKNPLFTTAADQDKDKARFWNNATPLAVVQSAKPNINRVAFTNPITGGPSCLISEVEIYLDNQLVQASRDGFISIANTLNRLFLPAHKRQEIVGHEYMLHNEIDKDPLVQISKTQGKIINVYKPSYEHALRSFDAVDDENGADVTLQSDLDGIFPLCRPKNMTLTQITRCETGENQHPLLPPGIELTIRIRLNDPLHFRTIDTHIEDDKFFSNDAPTAEKNFPFKDMEYEIKDMSLLVQKIKYEDPRIQNQLSSGAWSCYFDQYIYRANGLPSGQLVTNTPDNLPPNTGLVYLAIVRINQLYKDPAEIRSSDGTRYALPTGLQKMVIRLNNKVILFENGLTINRDECASQRDAGLFYQYLRSRNLTTDSFHSFFPKKGKIGYKNAFPLDLTPYLLDEPSKIHVECHWNSDGCPADHYLCFFIPQAVNITRDSKEASIWKSTAQVS